MAVETSGGWRALEAAVRAALAEMGLDRLAREVDEVRQENAGANIDDLMVDRDPEREARDRVIELLEATRLHFEDRAAVLAATTQRLPELGLERVRFVDDEGELGAELWAGAPADLSDSRAAELLLELLRSLE